MYFNYSLGVRYKQQHIMLREELMYCFTSKAGFSKVGTYTGNGGVGTKTVNTGFEPAFIMYKAIDSCF